MTADRPDHDRALRITRIAVDDGHVDQMAADVAEGLAATPKRLSPKYFYDAVGSALFVRITELEEYYPTRTETAILERVADAIMADLRPVEVVELGSGASRKTRVLLERMHAHADADRVSYVPFEISEDAIVGAAEALLADYGWLDVHGIVGDFDHHLDDVPRTGRRLVAFLGSTLGNLEPPAQVDLLGEITTMLEDGDRFLLGVDLVKDVPTLVRAYDDDAGVTAAFNQNVLSHLNAALGADFELDTFSHVARWNAEHERVEMWLRSDVAQEVHVKALDLTVRVAEGEEIHTEISSKFTVPAITERLAAAGMAVVEVHTDPREWYAVVVAERAG